MTGPNLRVLIVDDEALGRQRLEDLLRHEEGVEIAGFADNGDAAIKAIRSTKPDLVFLDVQMPHLTGLEVVRNIGPDHMPPTIFVTERGKLSERLRTVLNLGAAASGATPIAGGAAGTSSEATPGGYLERIAVEMRGQVRVVPVATIEYISASGPYAEIHVGDHTYIIRERMQTLEERLDPAHFFRIHRSVIVKLDQIETLLREAGGDYAVQLRCGARLSVSRNRVEPLEKWMGLAKAR
jgi:two-component system LytT family response regulator